MMCSEFKTVDIIKLNHTPTRRNMVQSPNTYQMLHLLYRSILINLMLMYVHMIGWSIMEGHPRDVPI